MNLLLWGAAALVAIGLLYWLVMRSNLRRVARYMRWVVGGIVALLTAFLLVRGQVAVAGFTGYAAFTILRYGRIGPWSFESAEVGEDNASAVKSRFISMTLDHDSGTVEGRVIAGSFKGANLMELDEAATRQLLAEVSSDPDSLALLETWLDRNRDGWREYFEAGSRSDGGPTGAGSGQDSVDPDKEAYEILGLKPGATEDEIRAAYRKLMMGVHPDQGGSEYLAAKINQAKDRLLKKARR